MSNIQSPIRLPRSLRSLAMTGFACLLAYLFIGLFVQSASALNMSNSNYIIQMGNLNSFAGKKSGSGFSLSDTGGQIGPGLYSGPNYKVRSGFQYISSIIKFSFKISGSGTTRVDFGNLDPTSPVLRYQTLTVSNGSGHGYVVSAQENHPLISPPTGITIPDTTCDNGSCTQTTASAWTSSLTYGFGYRCDQIGATNYCVSDFASANDYKQFADISNSEIAQTVMQSSTVGRNQQVNIKYKVNVSATQQAGTFSNLITYIATPTY